MTKREEKKGKKTKILGRVARGSEEDYNSSKARK